MRLASVSAALDAARRKNQEILSDLLATDLNLAHTFLGVASVTGDQDHEHASVQHAKNALTAIRRLSRRIEDAALRRRFQARANRLQTAIEGTEKHLPNSGS